MLNRFFISKEEIGNLKVSPKNPLGLTCESITRTPRVFSTSQIKTAIENISILCEEISVPELLIKTSEYILKDFFIYMHQTGLYNRQLALWKTLANITRISFSKLKKGIFKKSDLNKHAIDFFIDPQMPCMTAIIDEDKDENTIDFKTCLSTAISVSNLNRIKGIFYLSKIKPKKDFMEELDQITKAFDPISKYESRLLEDKDIRLNVINYEIENEKYIFSHVYPQIKEPENG